MSLGTASLSEAERAAGLTKPLPPAERILWQVRPAPRAMAARIFHLHGVATYFALAAAAVALAAWRGGRPPGQAIAEASLLLPFALASLGLLAILGRMTARATTYTLTNRRLILHIGIAYEMTVSVPLSAIRGAGLRRRADGSGDVVLSVKDAGGAGYVALWPHVRAWTFWRPQPMLRALPDVEAAAELIGDALVAFNAGGRATAAGGGIADGPELALAVPA